MTTSVVTPLTTNQDFDPVRLREAFGVFPTGVVAVAAEVDDVVIGLAASSFTSVSLDPPIVSFSIANTSATWPVLRRSEHVGLSVLAEQHAGICRQLAGPVAQRFAGVDVTVLPGGAVLVDEGLAGFVGTVDQEVRAGDHTLVLLRLHAIGRRLGDGGGPPLVFHRSGFRGLGRQVPTVGSDGP